MIEKLDARNLTYQATDLIVTDPPYNIGYEYAGDFVDKVDDYEALFKPMRGHRVVMVHYIENIISDVVPILGNPEKVVAWVSHSNLPRCWRAVCWWNCSPQMDRVRVPYRNMTDKRVQALHDRTGGRRLPDWWHIEQVKNVSTEKVAGYTNQIPREVVSRIIQTTANPADCIVDPFCGTGTTAEVARELGHSYRTYDINEVALKLARQRLSQTCIPIR